MLVCRLPALLITTALCVSPLCAQTHPMNRTPRVQNARLEPSAFLTATSLSALDEDNGSTTASASSNGLGPVGIVPVQHGWNMSLGTTSQHDSASGWSSILTPNLAYRFSRHFSANIGLPVYSYIDIYSVISSKGATKTSPAKTVYGFKPERFLLGDTILTGEFETHSSLVDYSFTTSLGMPTGNDLKGLGAGQATYSLNNHLEKSIGDWFTPEIEVGIGNSVNLNDERVRKSYVDVGHSAHFQAGLGIALPHDMSFSSEAYEDMPLGTQTITSTTTNGKKGKQLKKITTTKNISIGEDNGFLNTLDIPLNRHVTLSGFYNRSLRNRIDTAGFSFTFLLRPSPRAKDTVE